VVGSEQLPEMSRRLGPKTLSGQFECPSDFCTAHMTAANRLGGIGRNSQNLTPYFRLMPGKLHSKECDYPKIKRKSGGESEPGERARNRPPNFIEFKSLPEMRLPSPPAPAVVMREDISPDFIREDIQKRASDTNLRCACWFFSTGRLGPPADDGEEDYYIPTPVRDRLVQTLRVVGCDGSYSYGTVFRHTLDLEGASPNIRQILYAKLDPDNLPRIIDDVLLVPLYRPDLPLKERMEHKVRLNVKNWTSDQKKNFLKFAEAACEAADGLVRPWFFFVGRVSRKPDGVPIADPGCAPSVFVLPCAMPEILRPHSEADWEEEPESPAAPVEPNKKPWTEDASGQGGLFTTSVWYVMIYRFVTASQ
jgi:hypothetical protein